MEGFHFSKYLKENFGRSKIQSKHINIHLFLLMSRRAQPSNQSSNQAENQPRAEQRDRWIRSNSDFAGEVYDRFDSLEKSMNTRMDNMEKSMNTRMDNMEKSIKEMESSMNKQMDDIKDSIKTFKQSFSQKAIGILFRDFDIQ